MAPDRITVGVHRARRMAPALGRVQRNPALMRCTQADAILGCMIRLKHGLLALCAMVAVSLSSAPAWADVQADGPTERGAIVLQADSVVKTACRAVPACDMCSVKVCDEHAVGCGSHCVPSALIPSASSLTLIVAHMTTDDSISAVRDRHGPPNLRPPNPIIID